MNGLRGLVLVAAVTAAPVVSVLPHAGAGPVAGHGKLVIADFATRQLWLLNPDGSGLHKLTHVRKNAAAGDPDWSPDGTHVAFDIARGGGLHIYTIGVDGHHRHLVFRDARGFLDLDPAYFPGGNRFAFVRCIGQFEACEIASVRADGTHLHALTGFIHDRLDVSPTVAPNGKRLAFTRFGSRGIQSQIFVARVDGSHAHAVSPPALTATQPFWAPDSSRLGFSSNCCRLGGDGYTVAPDGSHLRRLTHTPYPLASIPTTYSPSGARIALYSNRRYPDRSRGDLFIMGASGRHQHRVKIKLDHIDNVAWGPSG